jgi:hypothetical protein
MKTILLLGLLALCASCTSSLVTGKIAPKAAQVITAYCLEPQSTRLLVREQVNSLITPNAVRIDCAGDVQ